jgi:superoxide dismutase, Fe-Mn family
MDAPIPSMLPAMELALAANFGSVARWREDFAACAKAQVGGSGKVLLSFQPSKGSLVNQRTTGPDPDPNAHHAECSGVQLLALVRQANTKPLDHGAVADAGVDAFMAHIDWAAVYERYQHAVHAASEGHGAQLDDAAAARLVAHAAPAAPAAPAAQAAQGATDPNAALVIDVRRAGVYQKATTTLPGARWLDPAQVGTWAEQLPRDREVLVYCIYGHEVGRATALRLRAAGVNARYLEGGIDAWQSAGRPVQTKPAPKASAP